MAPFTVTADGIRVSLDANEIDALRVVPDLLASVGEVGDDPAQARLDIDAYRDDAESAAEYRRLMASEMEAGRAADRSAFSETLDALGRGPVTLSPGESEAWLTVLGEARLALAARLGIEEEGWGQDEASVSSPPMALLHYLSWLQGGLAEVLLETL